MASRSVRQKSPPSCPSPTKEGRDFKKILWEARMRAVVQRVKEARVDISSETVGAIGVGLLIFLGVGEEDSEKDAEYMADKVVNLRIFPDEKDLMNLSLLDTGGSILVVSQFTLWGDCRKGRRPSFAKAARPERANELYEYFIRILKEKGLKIATGRFQEMMDVHLVNDGPVTLLIDSAKAF
jgi:D-aminoacyl-tRNA deacylase